MGKAHGLKGEINFQFTDDVWDKVESDYLICEVDGILVPFFIEEYRFRIDTTAIMKFEDIDTIDAVQMLVNSPVFIEKRYQQELDEDEVSLHYFIGFQMIDGDTDELIGTITGDWLAWDFKILDKQQNQLATISKKWNGAMKEFFTDSDKYVISVSPQVTDDKMRMAIISASAVIDKINKEMN